MGAAARPTRVTPCAVSGLRPCGWYPAILGRLGVAVFLLARALPLCLDTSGLHALQNKVTTSGTGGPAPLQAAVLHTTSSGVSPHTSRTTSPPPASLLSLSTPSATRPVPVIGLSGCVGLAGSLPSRSAPAGALLGGRRLHLPQPARAWRGAWTRWRLLIAAVLISVCRDSSAGHLGVGPVAPVRKVATPVLDFTMLHADLRPTWPRWPFLTASARSGVIATLIYALLPVIADHRLAASPSTRSTLEAGESWAHRLAVS